MSQRGSVTTAFLAAGLGAVVGLGFFTFVYARGGSYLTNDPEACANCHVMREQLDAWNKGSHRKVAVCNDCHAPHDTLGKYTTKAVNGFFHSLAFTTGRFPENMQITKRNQRVTDQACMSCHNQVVDGLRQMRVHREGISCLTCHRDAGHKH